VLSTVSLVTSSLELKADTVPETFYFDTNHLGFARERIERIVDATTVFVTASQNIGAPTPEKRLVSSFCVLCNSSYFSDHSQQALTELSNTILEEWDTKPFRLAELVGKFDQILDDSGVVFPSPEEGARLRKAIETNTKQEHPVRKLM
jgi:hypothetical protein